VSRAQIIERVLVRHAGCDWAGARLIWPASHRHRALEEGKGGRPARLGRLGRMQAAVSSRLVVQDHAQSVRSTPPTECLERGGGGRWGRGPRWVPHAAFLGAPVDHRRACRLLFGGAGVGPPARRAAASHAPDPSTSRLQFRHERPASPPVSPLPSVALLLHDLLAPSVAPVTALGLKSTTRAPAPLLHVPPTCTLICISTAPRLAPHGSDNHHPLRPLTATLAATCVRVWPPPSASPRCFRHTQFGAFARRHGDPRQRAVPDCRATI